MVCDICSTGCIVGCFFDYHCNFIAQICRGNTIDGICGGFGRIGNLLPGAGVNAQSAFGLRDHLVWSAYPLVTCLILGAIVAVIDRTPVLKEKMGRKFFI